jgi:4-hydroxy-3-polyprenylbenzoate decarboxylase
MPYYDIREFVNRLEAEGELKRVKVEVDWNLEVGAITQRGQDLRAPAPLFEKVKGYPQGFRMLGNILGPTMPVVQGRLALALDLPKDTPTMDLIEEFGNRIKRPVKPIKAEKAPCKENIIKGDDVNVLDFPTPLLHAIDGGRFLGTWHIDIIKDPESGWVNWGTYRHMVHDEKTLGFLAHPVQHGPRIYYEKYESKGKPMPMAIALGVDPVCSIAAGSQFPAYVNEAEMAGALRGQPVELVSCETCDLEVPAGTEIVLEGEVISERRLEGPFAEFTGYSAGPGTMSPVFKVKCITYRDSPIHTFSSHGKPWDDGGVLNSVQQSSLIATELRKAGIPFKSLYVLPHNLTVVVSAKPAYPGFAHTVASAIWGSKPGILRPYIILVGEDVDVTSADEVLWCLTTRLHPEHGIHVQKGTSSISLWPFITPEEREKHKGARILFDANFPPEWPVEHTPLAVSFETAWPEEIKQKVISRWREYGLNS